MMHIAMSGLPTEAAFLYIDDLVVIGCSIEHHLKNLKLVFKKLRERNLKLNPEKCAFLQSEVTYLGHHLSEKGIQPDPAKFDMVKNFPKPTNSDEVRRFVAFCNYYRRFVENFATLASPLNRLLRKNIVFDWSKNVNKHLRN
jgi:Reverse transcriptase (RNA-dependent DNA polymerase)